MKPLTFILCFFLSIFYSSTSAQTASNTNSPTRAVKGDTVWVIVNHIKPDKTQQFEKFVSETFWGMAKKLDNKDQMVFRQTRILYPTKAEPDGTLSYIFLMDPLVSDGDYEINSLLTKIYGDQKAAEYNKVLEETFASDQSQYLQVQSQY